MNISKYILIIAIVLPIMLFACKKADNPAETIDKEEENKPDYSGLLFSDIYEVTVRNGGNSEKINVFVSKCPEYNLGFKNMIENDQYPLTIFSGRSINWCQLALSGTIDVEVKILNKSKVPSSNQIRILPSRHGVSATLSGENIKFTLNKPGQYSVEIGNDGYKNGLIIFADPPETDIPDISSGSYKVLKNAGKADVTSLNTSLNGIYFKSGVHDIGVFKVPAHIKNIYFEKGSWVYGSIIMDGCSGVKIFGRGILSSGKLNYRESHCIEAINQSNNITINGIVIADPKYFAVRLIGSNNNVSWTKVIGGWVYNCDGIAAYEGSFVTNCFIWANDDAIKVFRNNITWSDCVVWQLNNGGVIQMAWGGSNSENVKISRVDILRAEWNKPGFNRGIINCVGNRYKEPGKTGIQKDWLVEDIVTENPVPVVFNISPDEYSPNHIENLTLKNWNVTMVMGTVFKNTINGNDPNVFFDGFVFDNVIFNGQKLTSTNWLDITGTITTRLNEPFFK